jgi:hypothetical protein
MKCVSYINGIFEKEYASQTEVVEYLKSKGYVNPSKGNISTALTVSLDGKVLVRYDRTWKIV